MNSQPANRPVTLHHEFADLPVEPFDQLIRVPRRSCPR